MFVIYTSVVFLICLLYFIAKLNKQTIEENPEVEEVVEEVVEENPEVVEEVVEVIEESPEVEEVIEEKKPVKAKKQKAKKKTKKTKKYRRNDWLNKQSLPKLFLI